MYRVVYLDRAIRRWLPGEMSLRDAERSFRALKRRGFTTWIETSGGAFVPVKGAMRQPGFLGNPKSACACGCGGTCGCSSEKPESAEKNVRRAQRNRSDRIVNPGTGGQRLWNRVKNPHSIHGHGLRARVGNVRYDAYETKKGWVLEEHCKGVVSSKEYPSFGPILERVERAGRRI